MAKTDLRPSGQHIQVIHEIADALLPALREVARQHGYNLIVHGSLERDIDLVAVPWAAHATGHQSLMPALFRVCCSVYGFCKWCGNWIEGASFPPPLGSISNPEPKPHGRLSFVIILYSDFYLDVSVMPIVEKKPEEPPHA